MKIKLIIFLFFPLFVIGQQKLQKAKQSLQQKSTSHSTSKVTTSTSTTTNTTYSNNLSEEDNPLKTSLVKLIYHVTLGVAFGTLDMREFHQYPYFEDNHSDYSKNVSATGKTQRFSIDASVILNKIKGFDIKGVYHPVPIIGIEASHVHFFENDTSFKDNLGMTSLMVNYHRIREKYVDFYWGVGATYVANKVDKLGFAYQLGLGVYPIKPVSLSLSYKQSFINDATINVFDSKLKYHFKDKAIYLGYNNYQIGSERIDAPVIGFKSYF